MGSMRRLAYDGRGNFVVRSEVDMASGVAKLGGFEAGLYAEAWVPFVKVWHLHTAPFQGHCSEHLN